MLLKVKDTQNALTTSILIILFATLFLYFTDSHNVLAQSSSLTNALTYSNPAYNISIKYPSNWEKDETDYSLPEDRVKNIVGFYSPIENPSDPIRESLYVSRDAGIFYEADLNEYLEETINSYETEFSDFRLLQSDITSTLSGRPAYSLTFTYTFEAENEDEEDIPMKQYEIGTLVNNTDAYLIAFDAEESAFERYFQVARGMIDTFKIDPNTSEVPPTPTPTPTPDTAGTAQQTLPSGFSEYINSGYGVKMNHPSNWEVMPPSLEYSQQGQIVTFLSPVRNTLDIFRENVMLWVSDFGTNAQNMQDYLNLVISSQNITQSDIVSSTTNYTLSGNPAIKLEYVFAVDGVEYQSMYVGTLVDNKEYALTFSAEKSSYPVYLPAVEEMINSFEISQKETNGPKPVVTPFIELYNSIQWLSDNLTVHIVVNQDTQEQSSKYLPVVEESINQWSNLLKQYSGNYNAWNFVVSSSVGYLDSLGANASKNVIIELIGDPQALMCSEALGVAEISHQDYSKGIPVGIITSCTDEEGNAVDFPEDDVYSTALHEFGHSLGLGHAFNMNGDLMCSTDTDGIGNEIETCTSGTGRVEPSEADIMALLYKYGKDGFSEPNRDLIGIRPVYQPGTPIE